MVFKWGHGIINMINLFKWGVQQTNKMAPVGFKTEWTVAGDATARTITLPLYNSGTFNCTVKWGDGTADSTVTAYNDTDRIHTYASDGTYTVEITGTCPSWSFNNTGDKLKITDIIYWGNSSGFSGFKYLTNGFYGCTNLKTTGTGKIIPYDSTLTSLSTIFRNCTTLTSITTGLFDNCVNVQTFDSLFYSCTGLTSLSTDLFRYNTSATNFLASFNLCTNLATLPADLFKYNVLVTTFQTTFATCLKLQLRSDIFYAAGESGTRFLNKSVNFTNCFNRASFTGSQGTAPDLWNCDFGTGTATKTDCFNGAGNSLTSLTNYADIPAAWL